MSVVLYTDYIATMNTLEALTQTAGNAMCSTTGSATITITAGGTGYTNGTYKNVPATTVTGTGTGMLLNLTIAGGIITVATCVYPGTGYVDTDTVKPDETIVGTPSGAATLTISDYVTGTRPVQTLLTAINTYKNAIESQIGSGITWSAKTITAYTGESVYNRTVAIGQLQSALNTFEFNIPQEAINNNIVIADAAGHAYTNTLREARSAVIADFYAAYKNEYDNLNP